MSVLLLLYAVRAFAYCCLSAEFFFETVELMNKYLSSNIVLRIQQQKAAQTKIVTKRGTP